MNTEKIASLIKTLRQKDNLTQNEFAKKYGVTYQAVSKWENGKNLPDVALLKEICSEHNISLDEVLDTQVSKKKNKNLIILISTLIVLTLVIVLTILFHSNNSEINFKTVTSNCEDFNIFGSLAYNKNNSHLHLSNVTYCGGDDTSEYTKIECNLYEQKGTSLRVLDTCKYKYDGVMSLDSYLKKIDFDLKDFSKNCNDYDNSSLYIEINATDEKNKTITYKIPLNLSKTCNKK